MSPQRSDSILTWDPVSEAEYDQMLGVLPPIDWVVAVGFLVGEATDHRSFSGYPRYRAYRRIGDGFYVSSRPVTRFEWHEIRSAGEKGGT